MSPKIWVRAALLFLFGAMVAVFLLAGTKPPECNHTLDGKPHEHRGR